LTVLVLALFGAAIWFSADRRRTLRDIGIGFALVGFLVLAARVFGVGTLAGRGSAGTNEPASSVLNIGTSLLRQAAFTEFVIGLMLIAFAVLVGPTAAAARVREFASPAMRYGPVSAVGGGLVLALVVSWFRAPGPGATWLPIVFFFTICLGGAAWFQRVTVEENPV
jgi:hypothetical protein